MKLTLKGKRLEVTLDKRNFLAKGGEGEVYSKGSVVYKVCEPGKMIPEQKFKELAVLDEPHIIRPEDILVDPKGVDVGYTMKLVPDAYTLCQLFTKAFRTRNNVTPDMVLKLVRQMQATTGFIHSKRVLLVDYNELNFLLDAPLENVFFIDVNSYQTPHYPATAIMESIRDRHCNNVFSEGTDWFSFAVVSFQMFIGIHPYKGNHPRFTDKNTAMDERMKANISVLNTDVSYPKGVCQPLSVIPDAYLKWYEAVLDRGMRVPPPMNLIAKIAVITTVKTVKGSNNFDIELLKEFAEEIIGYRYSQGTEVVLCHDCVYVNNRRVSVQQPVQVGFMGATPLGVWSDHGSLNIQNLLTGDRIPITCNVEKIFTSGDRVYGLLGGNVLELTFTGLGSKVLAGTAVVGTYIPQSTKVFEGCLIQTLFDATIASIFPNSKENRQIAIKELNGLQVVDARYHNRLLGVITVDRQSKYARHTLRFAPDWSYEIRTVSDVSVPSLNFVGLPSGIGVLMNEAENVEIFRVDNPAVKEIDDPVTEGDMTLTARDSQVQFYQGKKLYSIKVRK
jgi:serine/threonine protein kinase